MNRLTSAIDAVRMDDMHSTEEQFRASHPLLWRSTLYGPPLLSLAFVGLLLWQTGWEFTSKLVTAAVITVCFLGRFIILSGSDGTFTDTDGQLASEHLFALVCYLDVMTALILAFHIGFLFRLPYVGSRIAALVSDGHFILDSQPWMRRATFFGLIAFVGFPLAATGSIGGSIFGRLLGMSRLATFFGIVTGTLLGNSTMFFFSDLLGHYVDKNNIYLKYGGFLIIVVVVLILERRYRTLKQRYARWQAAAGAGGPAEPEPPDDVTDRKPSRDSVSRAPSADVQRSTEPPETSQQEVDASADKPLMSFNPVETSSGDRVGSRPDTR